VGRPRPVLLASVVLAALLTAGGLSACDAGRPPAARVGDVEISADQLIRDLEAEAAKARKDGSETSPKGDVDGTWSATTAAELLGQRIRYELLGKALAAAGHEVTGEERDLARQSLCSGGASGQTQTQQQGCPGLDGYPQAYRTFRIELAARGNAYQSVADLSDPTERVYAQLREEDPDQLEVQCYLGASIPDDSAVEQIQLAVAGGQTFADAVGAVEGASANPDQLCQPSAAIPDEVTSADEGVVLGPFQSQDGSSFVIQVQERRLGTLDDDGITQTVQASETFQQVSQRQQEKAVEGLLSRAKIEVDPRFGRWDRTTATVVPPKGPVAPGVS
jgi:hypothetical protein